MIFVINGVSASGKDTFMSLVRAEGYSVDVISTIDRIKEGMGVFGVFGKGERERKILNTVKLALREYNDFAFISTLERVRLSSADIIFIVCREAEEIEKFRETLKAQTILIKPTGDFNPTIACGDEEVYNIPYNHVIPNSGRSLDFKIKTREFLSKVEGLGTRDQRWGTRDKLCPLGEIK